MDQICVYRFAVAVLLQSPWTSLKSTRSPLQFKNNSRSALFLAFRPLSFPVFEPVVQPHQFYVLDPRSNI